jgi:hypothetical protein
MTNIFKKAAILSAAVLTVGVAFAASADPAEARWGRRAFVGGAALGILGAAAAAHAYHAPRYGYVVEGGECWRERRAVYNRYGDFVGYRNIRICN